MKVLVFLPPGQPGRMLVAQPGAVQLTVGAVAVRGFGLQFDRVGQGPADDLLIWAASRLTFAVSGMMGSSIDPLRPALPGISWQGWPGRYVLPPYGRAGCLL